MTRPEQKYHAGLGPLRVYLDDIERSVDLLSSHGWSPTVRANGRPVRGVKQLAAAGDVSELELEARHADAGFVYVTLSPYYAVVTSRSGDPAAARVCDEIRQTLGQRQVPPTWFTYGWLFPAIAGVFVLALFLGGYRSPLIWLGFLASVPLAAVAWARAFGRHSVVILQREADQAPTWLQQNWDCFAPYAATALICLVIGYGARVLESRFATTGAGTVSDH